MYKCFKCGKIVPGEKLMEGSSPMCSCGSRIFVKVRPQLVRRVLKCSSKTLLVCFKNV